MYSLKWQTYYLASVLRYRNSESKEDIVEEIFRTKAGRLRVVDLPLLLLSSRLGRVCTCLWYWQCNGLIVSLDWYTVMCVASGEISGITP